MKKLIVLCFLCFVMSFAGVAQATNYGVITAQERILTLPQDQDTWYVSVFGETNDPKFHELKAWFMKDQGLTQLKRQVHFNEYTTDQVRYERYAGDMPGLPCVRIQNGKGVVTSEFWGTYIPMTSEALFQGILGDVNDKASWGCLRKRRERRRDGCPCPQPRPQPEPPIGPPPIGPPPIGPPILGPDPEPDPEPEPDQSSSLWIVLLGVAAALGAGIGFAQGYKAEHLDQPAKRISKP